MNEKWYIKWFAIIGFVGVVVGGFGMHLISSQTISRIQSDNEFNFKERVRTLKTDAKIFLEECKQENRTEDNCLDTKGNDIIKDLNSITETDEFKELTQEYIIELVKDILDKSEIIKNIEDEIAKVPKYTFKDWNGETQTVYDKSKIIDYFPKEYSDIDTDEYDIMNHYHKREWYLQDESLYNKFILKADLINSGGWNLSDENILKESNPNIWVKRYNENIEEGNKIDDSNVPGHGDYEAWEPWYRNIMSERHLNLKLVSRQTINLYRYNDYNTIFTVRECFIEYDENYTVDICSFDDNGNNDGWENWYGEAFLNSSPYEIEWVLPN